MAPVYGGNLNMNVGGAENKVQLIKSLIRLDKYSCRYLRVTFGFWMKCFEIYFEVWLENVMGSTILH